MFKNEYNAVEFGKRIRDARKRAGMTQEQLADKLYNQWVCKTILPDY